MDVHSLEIFLAIAEEGSIHGGARRALIAQPAASKTLRKLERQLRTDLVIRSPRGIVLTSAGEVLAVEAKQILARIHQLTDTLGNVATKEPLVIGLVSGNLAAGEFTFDIVKEFRSRCPSIDVRVRELSFTDQYAAVSDGVVDLAIVRSPCDRGDLTMVPLFSEPRVLAVREDSTYAGGDHISVSQILDEKFVNLAGSRPEWASFWYLDHERNGSARTTTDIATTAAELQYALLAGDAVMPIAQSAWRMGLLHRDLRAITMADAPPSEVAIAFSHSHRQDEIQAFIECARTAVALRQEPGIEVSNPPDVSDRAFMATANI